MRDGSPTTFQSIHPRRAKSSAIIYIIIDIKEKQVNPLCLAHQSFWEINAMKRPERPEEAGSIPSLVSFGDTGLTNQKRLTVGIASTVRRFFVFLCDCLD